MMLRIALGLAIGAILGALIGYMGKCEDGACPLTANPWRGMLWGSFLGGMAASML